MKTKLVAALLLLLTFAGCTHTNPLCPLADSAVVSGSKAVAGVLQCSNIAAIEADLAKIVEKVGVCSEKPKLNPFICGLIADLVVHQASQQVPATWGCTLTDAKGTLKSAVVTACQAIPL